MTVDELPKVLVADEVCDLLRAPRDPKGRRALIRQLIADGHIALITPCERVSQMRFSRDRVLAYIDGESEEAAS